MPFQNMTQCTFWKGSTYHTRIDFNLALKMANSFPVSPTDSLQVSVNSNNHGSFLSELGTASRDPECFAIAFIYIKDAMAS